MHTRAGPPAASIREFGVASAVWGPGGFASNSMGPYAEEHRECVEILGYRRILLKSKCGLEASRDCLLDRKGCRPSEKVWVAWHTPKGYADGDADLDIVSSVLSGGKDSRLYSKLVKDLDITEAKHPDTIFKIKLDGGDKIESKKMNCAYSIVNAFVNAGMGNDALMIDQPSDETPWIHKNKDYGLTTAVASIGMVNMWDFQLGAMNIMDYLQYQDGMAK